MAESAFAQSSESEKQWLPPEQNGLRFWPWAALALVVLLVFLSRSWWHGIERGVTGAQHPAVGQKITSMALKPLTGDAREIETADLMGKVTLVNFWGPWCGACVVEFPHLVEIEAHFRGNERFQFLSVSSNFDPLDETGLAENTADFLKRHGADFPTYRDPRGQTTRGLATELKLENFGYPTSLLIGPDLTVLGVWMGYAPGDEKDVRQSIEKALRQ